MTNRNSVITPSVPTNRSQNSASQPADVYGNVRGSPSSSEAVRNINAPIGSATAAPASGWVDGNHLSTTVVAAIEIPAMSRDTIPPSGTFALIWSPNTIPTPVTAIAAPASPASLNLSILTATASRNVSSGTSARITCETPAGVSTRPR